MIKYIIFDLYGVLRADPYNVWLKSKNIKREGIYNEVAARMDSGEISHVQFVQELATLTNTSAEDIENELREMAIVDPGAKPTLEKLSARYPLALLSNGALKTRQTLIDIGLSQYFKELFISSEMGVAKPNLEAYRRVLTSLRIQPNEALYIDDNPENINAARSIGIQSLHFTNFTQLDCALKHILS